MNKVQRETLDRLADYIDQSCLRQFGRKMTYIATEKRAIPAELREQVGERREGGYDVTGEKVAYEVNHRRRLKRAYIKHGVNGVIQYARKLGLQPNVSELKQVL